MRNIPTAPGWRRVIVLTLAMAAMMGLAAQVTAQESGGSASAGGLNIVDVEIRGDSPYLTEEQIRSMLEFAKIGAPWNEDLVKEDRDRINEWVVAEYGGQVVEVRVGRRVVEPCPPPNPDSDEELSAGSEEEKCDLPWQERGIQVVFLVEGEKAPTYVAVHIDTDVMSEEWFRAGLDFKPGMARTDENRIRIVDSLYQMLGQLWDEEGILVEPAEGWERQVGPNEFEIHYTLRKAKVRHVIVIGNQKTRDFVIQREILTQPGDDVSRDAILADFWRLNHLGYFDDVVPDIVPTEEPLLYDLVYTVRERQTGMAGFGAGWSSASGVLGYLELTDTNLRGRGQQAQIRVEFGSKQTLYEIGFTEPRLFGTRVSVGFELFNKRQSDLVSRDGDKYEERRRGGSLSLGYRVTDHLHISAGYRMENGQETIEETGLTNTWRSRILTLGAGYDTTDSPIYPTAGLRGRVDVEMAGKFLGGDLDFTKVQGSLSSYHRVGRNDQVLAWRVLAGTGLEELPPVALFRVGGADTVRGYPFGAMLGDRMLVANLEYRFMATDKVQAVLFADVGNAWEHGEQISLNDLKVGYGLGIRMDTPIAPLRVDLAFGDTSRISFGFGQMF